MVTDGVTLGHPCCWIKDCQEELPNVKSRYCETHREHSKTCAVAGCTNRSEAGFRTCLSDNHRQAEEYHVSDLAYSHLRQRLARSGAVDEEVCNAATSALPRPKAIFRRRWTHNEQLVVYPCGVIVSRATMFSSEGVMSTRVCFPLFLSPYVCRLSQCYCICLELSQEHISPSCSSSDIYILRQSMPASRTPEEGPRQVL